MAAVKTCFQENLVQYHKIASVRHPLAKESSTTTKITTATATKQQQELQLQHQRPQQTKRTTPI